MQLIMCFLWLGIGAVIEANAKVSHAIICKGAVIKSGAVVPKGCIISFGVIVGEGVVLSEYTRISLKKKLEEVRRIF